MDKAGCMACPRACGIRRTEQVGFCGVSDTIKVSRAALHFWEEPCLSGESGSGTVFFSGCNLRCVFCQNYAISDGASGKEITPERLGEIFFELKAQGALNINLVTPTQFMPQILPVISRAKREGIGFPFVMNCGGFESVEMLKKAEDLIDIYLPDFKYFSSELSQRYSHTSRYAEVAKAALAEMVRQKPSCHFSDTGILTEGVLVRHMMLPGNLKDSKAILAYLYQTYGERIYISIMNQYTPVLSSKKWPELQRRVTEREYEALVDYALSLGMEQAFIQEGEAAKESFIPAFDNEGV